MILGTPQHGLYGRIRISKRGGGVACIAIAVQAMAYLFGLFTMYLCDINEAEGASRLVGNWKDGTMTCSSPHRRTFHLGMNLGLWEQHQLIPMRIAFRTAGYAYRLRIVISAWHRKPATANSMRQAQS
jgi:hypothetical protein